MSISFILLNYPQIFSLVVWTLIAVVLALRYFNISIFARVSYKYLTLFVIVLRIVYDSLLSYGQYITWQSNPFTKIFLSTPLTKDVPLLFGTEWLRPYLDHKLGYFFFYVYQHFFLASIITFVTVLVIAGLLKLWAYYKPTDFKNGDIVVIALTFLIVGYPGIVILLPLGFLILILLQIVTKFFFKDKIVYLPMAFLLAVPVVLFFSAEILKFFNLYVLLQL